MLTAAFWNTNVRDNLNDHETRITTSESAWVDWVPTISGATKGNGTVVARYKQVGKTVRFAFSLEFGSTSAMTSDFSFTLPVTGKSGYPIINATGQIYDNGGNVYATIVGMTTTQCYIRGAAANTTYVQYAFLASTIPMTWATGDHIAATGFYEAA